MNLRTPKPWLLPLIITATVLIFLLDCLTAKGSADYIFYFIPIMIASLHPSPNLPVQAALAASILSLTGFYLSPNSSTAFNIVLLNRSYSLVSMWIVAYLVRQVIRTQNENTETAWLRTSMNELAEKTRGELSTFEVGREILGFLALKVDMKVGALYIRPEGEASLSYLAGYAVSGPFDKLRINSGEGILGQVVREKKMAVLPDVPKDYLKIQSSLGEMSPRKVYAIPLLADNEVVGAVELAFLNPLSSIQLDLLKAFAEPAAIALRSSVHKAKLAELLVQAQQTAGELQAQQEELRVTNEELEQQSSALRETHVKLENQQAELEQSNQQLEEQAQALERQKHVVEQKNRDLRQVQLFLEEKARELERSSQYKSDFLANMSHELRTPLNSTLILARLLADNRPGNLTEEQIKFAQIIETSGTDLLNLINDILDLSKVEAGKMVINPEVVRLDQVLRTMDHAFTPMAMDRKLGFEIIADEKLPEKIVTDRQRVEQILKNLLSNAFKFTDKGSVTLAVRPEAEGVAFEVTDTGMGISPDKQGTIFQAFTQVESSSNRKYGGTGLGLSISKEFSRILGGRITLTSEEGKGSRFTLHLPLEFREEVVDHPRIEIRPLPPKAPPAEARVEKPLERLEVQFGFADDRARITDYSRRMLVIEDEEAFAKILYDLAHELKFGVLVAPTADEGLRLAAEHVPHAIVLDIRLPDHSGMIVLDQLKLDPRTRHIPVHMISSEDFSRSALEMGAMGYLTKPVRREQLEATFKNLASFLDKKMKRVLVLEDEKVQRDHIVQLVSDPAIEVDAVETAREALDLLSTKTYDCMIMDLSIPDMSGYDLLEKLSQDETSYSHPPVIVYTARDLTREEEEKLRLHSGSIIIKGAKSPERLLSEVTLFLHRVEADLPTESQKMLMGLRNRERSLSDRTILVVDDDVRNIFALTSSLESSGAKIVVARNGVEALEKLEEEKKIDLVLMDIMMPQMDGYEALARIRAQKRWADLPVIALTAKAMADDRQKCLDAGANDYLSKPINLDKLLSLIKVWLPSKRNFKL